MVIFVFGEDRDGVHTRTASLLQHFRTKYDPAGHNQEVFVVETKEDNLTPILSALASPPFLAEKKLIVVKGALTHLNKPESLPVIARAKAKQADIVLLFEDTVSASALEKHAIRKGLSDSDLEVHDYHFPALKDEDLIAWAVDHARALNLSIDRKSLRKLVDVCCESQPRLRIELARLKAYALNQPITPADIDALVPHDTEQEMFAFVDVLGSKDASVILPFLQAQRASGLEDGYLFAMSGRQIRLLTQAYFNERGNQTLTAKELGMHPFVYGKIKQQIYAFSEQELRRLHQEVYQLERDLKLGRLTDKDAMDQLVLAIVGIC